MEGLEGIPFQRGLNLNHQIQTLEIRGVWAVGGMWRNEEPQNNHGCRKANVTVSLYFLFY